ncbi:MAG: M1 family aminopeptidase [Nocardioides sp.]
MTMTRTALAGILACALVSGCSWLAGPEEEYADRGLVLDPQVSLTEDGIDLVAAAGLDEFAPRYDLTASVDPETGVVKGTVEADLPVGEDDESLTLRYFAGLPDFEAAASVGEVTVDGEDVGVKQSSSIVTVPLPSGHGPRVDLLVPFSYELGPSEGGGGLLDALAGMGGPADVGLLSRHENALNLGHWFPVWVPEGNSVDPDPAGYGDIGNFPAALMRLQLTVPDSWEVVDGGVRVAEKQTDKGKVTVVSEGYGMNDLVVSLLRNYSSKEVVLEGGALDGVVVTAYAPKRDEGELDGVLEETRASLETLTETFEPYPWKEFDVVSAPLGSGVGGMEWPGATWIEPSLFAGGLPGLGGLGDLLGDSGMEGLEGLEGLDGLGNLLGGAGGGETGRVIETLRKWTIAHEVGHEWWHIIVGNDSVLDPVVDEPLAQYSACLVLRQTEPGDVDALCRAHIESGYEQMRLMGDEDAAAAQATDDFASSGQYAGVVYGKAAAFYLELEEAFGAAKVAGALGTVTRDHAFVVLTSDDLRDALAAELGHPARFEKLWARWMESTHGDQDLDVAPSQGLGGLEGLEGLEGMEDLEGLLGSDPSELQDLLDQLLEGLESEPR